MIKINLERELLRQNKSLVSAKELLLINELDSLGEDVVFNEQLTRVFGETSAGQGYKIKNRISKLEGETKTFDQARVFHISQIEKLCKKYHLRFLPSPLFKGSIDKATPSKISQFEVATGLTCGKWQKSGYSVGQKYFGGNTYIAAPASSFELQQRPKDPLLFYKINDEFFYLIHKWGNDLNIIRRVYPILSNSFFSWLFMVVMLAPIVIFLFNIGFDKVDGLTTANGWGNTGVAICVVFGIITLLGIISGESLSLVEKNEWDSEMKD